MQIKIKLFASLRKQLGINELTMTIDGQKTVRDVIQALNLSVNENYITMINGVHGKLDHALQDGDVLSIFPMIAGG